MKKTKKGVMGEERMVKRLLLLSALSVVATLAFASVAVAVAQDPDDSNAQQPAVQDNFCTELNLQTEIPPFVPDVDGCVPATGAGSLVGVLNGPVLDPDTGDEIGIVKDLDPDLSSGSFSVTYQEFCGDFPISTDFGGPFGGLTAQQYFDQEANAQEREILDPNGDGQACTDEDEDFLAGDTTGSGSQGGDGNGTDGDPQDQYDDETDGAPQDQYDDETDGGGGAPDDGGAGDGGQQGDQILELPDTGGPDLLLVVAGLLAGSGILWLSVAIWRRA